MQVSHCGPQTVQGGPVTWQAVSTGTASLPPESQTKPKRRKGSSARTVTSIIQASLGVVLILCGIIAVSVVVSPHSSYRTEGSYNVMQIELRDKRSWGIWSGVLFIVIAVIGLFSRRSQVMIALYMAFSIFASLLAFSGIVSAAIQVGFTASTKNALDDDSSYVNPCRPEYGITVVTNSSIECIRRSNCYEEKCCVTMQEINDCVDEMRGKLVVHLVFHVIILICFLVEFVISITGASFTCVGLECCCRDRPQRVVYYQTQGPQFTGQPVALPPGVQIIHQQQYPAVSMPPPAGAPMVAPAVQQTSPPKDEYLIPDAPPAYQPVINQQEYAYAYEHIQPPASAPPAYEGVNQGNGSNVGNEPEYIAVTE